MRGRKLVPYLFVLPNMVVFGLFTIWPAINGFNVSFYTSHNGRTFRAVGLDNYHQILTSDEFWARQDEIVAPVESSDAPKEGATAFLEKRRPRWRQN